MNTLMGGKGERSNIHVSHKDKETRQSRATINT